MTTDRMPPIPDDQMTAAQRAAADALRAGPRKGVKGPFIPLMRSPALMDRLQRVGEYLRFDSALPPLHSTSTAKIAIGGHKQATRCLARQGDRWNDKSVRPWRQVKG